MAGGSGTRFWPYSRKSKPKQLLKIFGDQTMLQITIDRLLKYRKTERIYISTRQDLVQKIINETKSVTPENIIAEPSAKNTAPGIGLAALHIANIDPQAVMGIFPADHLIVGHHQFEKAIDQAAKLAVEKDGLVTIGVQPTFPSTAFGYIQYDADKMINKMDVFPVKTFAEKPHLNAAKRFLESKDFLWNAGIFVWRVDVFLEQIKDHMPELSQQLKLLQKRMASKKSYTDVWEKISPESIDYGLMEKASNIYVVKADFKWNDMGSWNAVYEEYPKREDGNVVKGKGIVIKGNNNFIHNTDHFTTVIGLDNVMVINTPDATLVVNKDNVEDVKEAVHYLIEHGYEDLL